jgi:hypothetical protein
LLDREANYSYVSYETSVNICLGIPDRGEAPAQGGSKFVSGLRPIIFRPTYQINQQGKQQNFFFLFLLGKGVVFEKRLGNTCLE